MRVDLGRDDLAGELIIEGRPMTTFTGWLGLLTALDQALDTLRPPGPKTGAVWVRTDPHPAGAAAITLKHEDPDADWTCGSSRRSRL